MSTIAEQLKELADLASFTRVDMAAWCDSGKSAMREWMINGVTPHPIRQKHILERMELLRWVLANTDRFPVPISTKRDDRTNYVIKVRDHALKEFSKRGTSKRRV